MNTHHLSTFVQIAEMQSITRAAESMHVSQPAVSAQISRLEDEFGIPLISKLGRGIVLTDAGRTLLEYAQAMLGIESQAIRVMREFRDGGRGRIVVGASSVVGIYTLPKHIASFQKLHKDFEVELQLHADSAIERLVQEGHIDIGIMLNAPMEHLALRVTRLVEDSWIGVESARTEEGTTLFLARDGSPGDINQIRKEIQWQESTETVKQFVQEGAGRAILLRSAVASELALGTLQIWNEIIEQPVSISLVSRPAERLGVSLWNFINHLLPERSSPR